MGTRRTLLIEEANALVPELIRIFDRLTQLKRELAARANEVERLGYGALDRREQVPEEIHERRRIIAARADEFQREVDKIEALGAVLEDLDLGLVAFPSDRGRLRWQYGESAVRFAESAPVGA